MTDTTEWYELEARWSSRELWAIPTWEGKSEYGPWLLPDGRDITDVIATGEAHELGYRYWFEPPQSWRRAGDLLWSGGLATHVASERFVDVLSGISATGYRTYPAPFRTQQGEPIPGFVGLAVTSNADDTDLRHPFDWPSFTFRVRPRVLTALRAFGVTALHTRPWAMDE